MEMLLRIKSSYNCTHIKMVNRYLLFLCEAMCLLLLWQFPWAIAKATTQQVSRRPIAFTIDGNEIRGTYTGPWTNEGPSGNCVMVFASEPWSYDEEIKSTLLVFRCGCFDCDRGWMYVVICLSLVACELEVLFWLVHVLNYVR